MPDSYGYVRLSINADGTRISCDLQEADLRAAAERNGDRIVHVFRDDSLSAWRPDVRREGFEDLMARIEARDPVSRRLYLGHVDRFVRQIYDLGRVLRHRLPGTVLHSDRGERFDLDDAHHQYRLTLDAAHAALSSSDTSRRVRRGLLEAAEAGRPHGGRRPFGYWRDVVRDERGEPLVNRRGGQIKSLKVREDEAVAVREVFAAFLRGQSRVSIAAGLQAAVVETAMGRAPGGVKSAYHTPWSLREVNHVLRSPVVAGWRSHEREVPSEDGESKTERDLVRGNWTPIIELEVWDDVQARLVKPRRVNTPDPANYLLSGLVFCGVCGALLVTSPPTRWAVRSYRCRRGRVPNACGGVTVSSARLDRFVAQMLAPMVDDAKKRRAGGGLAARRAEAEAKKKKAERILAELAEDYGAGRITREERDVSRAAPARARAEATLVLAERAPNIDLITGGLPWALLGPEARRTVARAWVREVRIIRSTAAGRVFDEDRVDVDWR